MITKFASFFYQGNPQYPSDKPYHFEVIETPETLEEWQELKGERTRVVTADEAEQLGITLPAFIADINLALMAENTRLKEGNTND